MKPRQPDALSYPLRKTTVMVPIPTDPERDLEDETKAQYAPPQPEP